MVNLASINQSKPQDGHDKAPERYRRYGVMPLCETCWQKHRVKAKKRASIKAEKLAERRRRIDQNFQHLASLPPGEQVPIRYAVDKLMSALAETKHPHPGSARPERWYRTYIRQSWELEKHLRIEKVRTRWMCDKRRVDAMDFAVFFYRWDEYAEV